MLEMLSDLLSYAKQKKRLFLLPILLAMLLLGALIVFSQGSVVAPFIYTLF